MKKAFIFPGQGSQSVGMGKALYEASSTAREIFGEVDEALKQKLSALMFNGPIEELALTENTQPALLAVSLAVLRTLEKEAGLKMNSAAFMAGHSLGEYSALAATRSIGLADTARLLKRRGQAMQKAVPQGQGAMAALLGVDLPVAQEIAKLAAQGQICVVANDNSPGQVVISGHRQAIERAQIIAKEKGAKRCLILDVSVPSHSPLMAPAADEMADALADISLNKPLVPVVANVTAQGVEEPNEIRRLLIEQITNRVRWRESVTYMKEQGVAQMIEIGAGKVLAGLVKRCEPDITVLSIETPADIEAFLKLAQAA
ncbi:MAG: ACP S-malonyltransferase [Dongiaceae bacterium]